MMPCHLVMDVTDVIPQWLHHKPPGWVLDSRVRSLPPTSVRHGLRVYVPPVCRQRVVLFLTLLNNHECVFIQFTMPCLKHFIWILLKHPRVSLLCCTMAHLLFVIQDAFFLLSNYVEKEGYSLIKQVCKFFTFVIHCSGILQSKSINSSCSHDITLKWTSLA